jgi:Domain of unknown function (DUF5069)
MEPLDLTVRPPRGPREQMLGVYFLPRTIDKIRAELPGGKPGGYVVIGPNSVSSYVLHKLRIDVDELRAVVAGAANEDEVVAWLRERVDPAAVDELNGKLIASRFDTVPADKRALIEARHPVLASRPDIVNTFDLLEADDAATYCDSHPERAE